MARWLVTGAAGMLGRDMTALLRERDENVTGYARADIDITDEPAVAKAIADIKPDVVVNCAAWTAVDNAEEHEDDALAVNARGAANLAAACADTGTLLVHLSTDYVFGGGLGVGFGGGLDGGLDGGPRTPYAEDAGPAPRTAYGRTKLAGERAVLACLPGACYVVRTGWLYGAHGRNFVHTMLRLARAGASPAVVSDQFGQPTWTRDVAAQIYALIATEAPAGVYHATSSGETTWFGLAQEVFRLYRSSMPESGPPAIPAPAESALPEVVGLADAPGVSGPAGAPVRDAADASGRDAADAPVRDAADASVRHAEPVVPAPRPVSTAEFPRPAPRPAYSVLGHAAWGAAGIAPIGDWRDALRRAFPEMLAAAPPE